MAHVCASAGDCARWTIYRNTLRSQRRHVAPSLTAGPSPILSEMRYDRLRRNKVTGEMEVVPESRLSEITWTIAGVALTVVGLPLLSGTQSPPAGSTG